MLKYFAILGCCIVANIAAFAQSAIRGQIIDKASNKPIPYANILIIKSSPPIGAVSDSVGRFVIPHVAAGRYDLQISSVGYEPFILRELQISSAKQANVNISLTELSTEFGEIVVRPNINKEQPLNPTATVSARMLSVEEAKRFAGGFDDPARLVSAFAGVSSNVGNNGIIVRGNSPQSLQWKMEGVEIPNPNHFADMGVFGGGGLTALSTQLLANSDFFSGAFPAQYNNALSGVFDIFMRTGNNARREHTFQVGLTGIDAASEGAFRKDGRSSYLFNYRYSTLSLLAPLLPDNAGGVRYQDLSFKLHFPTQKAGVFSVWGIGLADRSGAKAKTDTSLWKYEADRQNQTVKQYMAAVGLNHELFLGENQYLKSTLAATTNGLNYTTDEKENSIFYAKNKIKTQQTNWILNTYLNTKTSRWHTNRTGITATLLTYQLQLSQAATLGQPLQSLVSRGGESGLLAAFSNSTLVLGKSLTANVGMSSQLFLLNNTHSIEPRVGLRYELDANQTFSMGYGLHSRLERLNYYFVQNTHGDLLNKKLGFSRAQHGVLGYDLRLSELMHLKAETYYQYLFDIPVMADSSFSLINQQNDWFFGEKLQSTGKGRNYGLDVTLEKYMSDGYYYLLTASVFDSRYRGGDGHWYHTRYNRHFAFNGLVGKEWTLGKNKQNILGLNLRVSYQGGDRYTEADQVATQAAQETVLVRTEAFNKQYAPALTCHFTASYKINKTHSAREIALKIINATMYQEYTGYAYNERTGRADLLREGIFIPNLSYRIEF